MLDVREYAGYYSLTFLLSVVITASFSLFFWEAETTLIHFLSITLSWLICFFLFPLWAGGYLIFRLRRTGIDNVLAEFTVLWLLFVVGYKFKSIVSQLLGLPDQNSMADTFTMTFFWSISLYSIERAYFCSKMLIFSRLSAQRASAAARRYQLNPHMLFNSINTISSLIHTNPEKADSVLHDMAALLRYSLDMSSNEKIPLSQEIDLLKKYVNLEKARYGDKLKIIISIDSSCFHLLIPPLVIQPLVENAIKHNVIHPLLVINVSITEKDNRVMVEVSDDGKGFPFAMVSCGKPSGVGLKNIIAQVNMMPMSTIQFSNKSATEGGGACVRISFAQ